MLEDNTPAAFDFDNLVEITLATYGQPFHGIQLSRDAADEYAVVMRGKTVSYPSQYAVQVNGQASGPQFRIIDTKLQDDNPGDPTKGRVVAICQPLPSRQMEVK